jgi:hypothetical protein
MSIDKYMGETDPRVWLNDYRLACQLGGATIDEVIIGTDVARACAG